MLTPSPAAWRQLLLTGCVWAAAAACTAYWVYRVYRGQTLAAGPMGAAAPVGPHAPPPDTAALARLLGAVPAPEAAPASTASRFGLLGVVAGGSRAQLALIAVDGRPARPFRVGGQLAEGYVLQSVGARFAMLAAAMDQPAVLTLALPAPNEAALASTVRPPPVAPHL